MKVFNYLNNYWAEVMYESNNDSKSANSVQWCQQRISISSVFGQKWTGFWLVEIPRASDSVTMAKALQINKKRKFVADGVFYSELNEVCS